MASLSEEPSIIIGIDFGTTYSGVAWTCSGKVDQIQVITSWNSQLHSNQDKEKTPTAIHYGSGSDRGRDVTWGFDIDPDKDPIRWFKLLLIDEEDLPEDVQASPYLAEAHEQLRAENKSVTQVTSFYLRNLWNHALEVIIQSIGKPVVNYSRFHVVVTVPAIWPQYARARMQEAVQEAGILRTRIPGKTTLRFITEPEAAALATIADTSGRARFKRGDSFVVADCGGGTADIISYKVQKTNPMTVTEIVEGQGALCGAIFVDEAFVALLRGKFGAAKWKKLKPASQARLLHNEWENGIKSQFDGEDQPWILDIPFECLDRSSRTSLTALPTVKLKSREIEDVFRNVTSKISEMVLEQICEIQDQENAPPKYLILVGGFGRCRYLQRSLSDDLEEYGTEILQSRGGDPWSAICRGAVIHGINTLSSNSSGNVAVRSRISRANYGIDYEDSPWSSWLHKKKDKVWSDVHQEYAAGNQMRWFLSKGQEIRENTRVRHSFCRYYRTAPRKVEEKIYISTASGPPRTSRNSSVRELASINWDADIDFDRLPTFTNKLGKVYTRLDFDIVMTCGAGFIDFAVYHDGKRQGSRNISVDFRDHGLSIL